jgi:hypothetical protein
MSSGEKEFEKIFSIGFFSFVIFLASKKKRFFPKFKKLWTARTTIKKLENLVKMNKKLPDVCVIPGILNSNHFIKPILFEPKFIPSFVVSLDTIDSKEEIENFGQKNFNF